MPINYELQNGVYALQNGVYADSLTQIVDDFEDSDIAEYGGDTGGYATQTSTVKNGSVALEASTGASGNTVYVSSKTGLDYYPQQGDIFNVWIQFTHTDDQPAAFYGVEEETATETGYMIRPNPGAGEFQLYEVSSGSFTQLAATTVSLSASSWYQVEVDWTMNGDHNCTLYDNAGSSVASISATDTTHTAQGIGFRFRNTSQGSSSYFDYYHVSG